MSKENDKFIQLQRQIRQNSYSVQDYVSDLSEWTEEVNKLDSNVKEGKSVKSQNKKLPPIRSVALENERIKNSESGSYLDTVKQQSKKAQPTEIQQKGNEEHRDFKRDVTPMPTYYNKWDKFDPEAAMEDIEKDKNIGFDKTLSNQGKEITKSSTNSKVYEPTPVDEELTEEERMQLEKEKFLKGTSGAKPNTKIVVKGGANPTPMSKVESMKKQGNTYFTALEYEKAIECYTKCLEMNPDDKDIKVVLYSNRSQ